MTVKELIRDLELACNGNTQKDIIFTAMFEVNISSPVDDNGKQIALRFDDCYIKIDHPTTLKITLV